MKQRGIGKANMAKLEKYTKNELHPKSDKRTAKPIRRSPQTGK